MTQEEIKNAAIKDLVDDVKSDFKRRQQERKSLERTWQLNMNFLCGNQYCDVGASGEIEQESSTYYWQPKRVFNYIAPTIEVRLAKLANVKRDLIVKSATNDEQDVRSASLATAILKSTFDDQNMKSLLSQATMWSETCGTAFYKVVWDNTKGPVLCFDEKGKVHEGDVAIVALSPFEIYPYSLSEDSIEGQPSIIHAKALPVSDIYSVYGVRLEGRDIDEFALTPYSEASHSTVKGMKPIQSVKHGYEVVIERYTRPNAVYPEGRLTIVAGDNLLYDGDLPYKNGAQRTRTYPFVKQSCFNYVGSFFGGSVVDRLIPVQRAYNAVKNRKHEFLNRITMGVVAVEDGAVDVDSLLDDGLMPGKILVYRQGGRVPEMLELGSVPSEFSAEEKSLQEEFSKISGTSEITQQSGIASVTSATGIQLIIEQNDARLNTTFDCIKLALQTVGRHILRLYRQFATTSRLKRCAGHNNQIDAFYFSGSDISSDDVTMQSDTNLNVTATQQRAAIFELIEKGLLSDENGEMSRATKNKLLNLLGYGGFIENPDLAELHRTKASKENVAVVGGEQPVLELDDHALHIKEHTAFILSDEYEKSVMDRVCAHIAEHKKYLMEEKK